MASTQFRSYLMMTLIAGPFFSGSAQVFGQQLDAKLTEYKADKLIRFSNLDQAEARREQLVRFIWPEGLPSARPRVTELKDTVPELESIDAALIRKVELYAVEVSGFDFHSQVYVIHPMTEVVGPTRLAIAHAGHVPEGNEYYFEAGVGDSIEQLLQHGFVVAAMQMPMTGWNRDADGTLPGGQTFQIGSRRTSGHNELFAAVEPVLKGGTFRFFLEPIVQVTNEFFASYEKRAGLLMIGLSGGGWTTHFSAAVDPRIDVSIPVAGSLPLYARPFSPGSRGDAEQYYEPLLGESDSTGDGVPDTAAGVASWLEIYALGSISPHTPDRLQVQVLNFYDSCCFSGPVYETYEATLTSRVMAIKSGQWRLHVDRSHHSHLISPETITKVLQPAIKHLAR